jgi:hypothetical protein
MRAEPGCPVKIGEPLNEVDDGSAQNGRTEVRNAGARINPLCAQRRYADASPHDDL